MSTTPTPEHRVDEPGRLLTPEQLAVRWSVNRSHIYRLTREDRLPVVKLGRYYRYRIEEISAFERDGGTS